MQSQNPLTRRAFVKKASILMTGALANSIPLQGANEPIKNKLPKWKGFNLLDFFSPHPAKARKATTEEQFKWMADWGFDFVRIPMAYPSYLKFDRSKNITRKRVYKFDKKAVRKVDQLVYMAHKHGLHVSLNLHRAPGFCVNAGFHEPYNLWKDEEALEAFCYHWRFWAKRYKRISNEKISFDLLNEPCVRDDMNDQHSKRTAVPGEAYKKIAVAAVKVIREQNPKHLVIADGNNIGQHVTPELNGIVDGQSCRGYHPGIISHYKAPWAFKDIDNLPTPKWPGQVGDQYLKREMLEKHFTEWIEAVKNGIGVHCGECGCYNKTPHDVFLAWFEDVLSILSENGIGFSLWEFRGDFGLLDSGREDVDYEDWYGYKLDRKLLELMMKY